MVRRTLTREITTTTIKAAKMEVVDGVPQAIPLADETVLGSLNLEKAQKHIEKIHGKGVTVFDTVRESKRYQMPIEEFISLATVVEDDDEENEEE